MKETAVEWLVDEFKEKLMGNNLPEWVEKIIEQAKAIEIEQNQKYAEFCVECDRKGMPLLDFKSWIEL